MCRSLLVLLCLAAPCAAERFVLDSDEFSQRRETSLSGQQVGPFRLYGGVARYNEGRGFGVDDDSFIRASQFNDFGPLLIETDSPARLVGGWFASEAQVGIVADINRRNLSINRPTFFDVPLSWQWVDLNISFINQLSIAGCDPIGDRESDNLCFFDTEQMAFANVDSLVFEVTDMGSVSLPGGSEQLPGEEEPSTPSNPIPEPASVALLAIGATIFKCSRIWRKSNRSR